MVRLGCVNDDCDEEPVELHFEDVEVFKSINVQCSCSWPRVPMNSDLDEKVQAAIMGSCIRFPEEYEDAF